MASFGEFLRFAKHARGDYEIWTCHLGAWVRSPHFAFFSQAKTTPQGSRQGALDAKWFCILELNRYFSMVLWFLCECSWMRKSSSLSELPDQQCRQFCSQACMSSFTDLPVSPPPSAPPPPPNPLLLALPLWGLEVSCLLTGAVPSLEAFIHPKTWLDCRFSACSWITEFIF